MTDKRYINDVNEIYDTWLGDMGNAPPTEWEIEDGEYFLLGVAYHQEDAERICEKLNEFSDNNQHLEYDNKRMVKFIMSKGYGLKDYLDFCKEYKE